MNNIVFYLKTCNTCMRILKQLDLPDSFELQDIKEKEISSSQLQELKELSGSYESLFSRRAKLYKEMGLKDQDLNENDYRYYILEHYTFLKRPVIVYKDQIFTGNSKKVIDSAIQAIHN